jgi:phospholipid-translocating ATPase
MTVPSTVIAPKSPDTAAVGADLNKPMTEPSHSAQAPGHTVPADADTPKSAPSTSRVANTLSFLSKKALSLLNMRRGSNMSAAPAPAQSRLIPLRLRTRQHPPSLPQLPSNRIHTAKYSVWTFLPKNMFEQFRRLANFYFLFLVILQCFPAFNVTDPIYAAVHIEINFAYSIIAQMPIIFIVTVTAIKDAIEDYKRHRSDRTINNIEAQCLMVGERRKALAPEEPWWHRFSGARRSDVTADPFAPIAMEISSASVAPAPTLQSVNGGGSGLASPIGSRKGTKEDDPVPATWKPTPWADLQVGDIVLLRNNDAIPADVVVLSTSEAEVLCYIETKNLDGETNLKIRSGFAATSGLTTPESMVGWRARVEMEGPNVNLYTSNGVLVVEEERKRRETAVTRRRSSEAAQRRSVLVEKITESVLEQRGMATVSEAEETPVAEAAGPGKLAVITTLPSTPSPVLADGVHGDDAPLSPAEGTPRALTLDLDRPSHSRSASEERRLITFSHLRANSDENSRQNRSNIGSPLARHSVLASTSASSMDPASPRSPASIRDVQTLPISINNLLLRGCTLRNTEWVIGIVVYTGVDTKLLLNSGATPSKRSMIEVQMNPQESLYLFLILLICRSLPTFW